MRCAQSQRMQQKGATHAAKRRVEDSEADTSSCGQIRAARGVVYWYHGRVGAEGLPSPGLQHFIGSMTCRFAVGSKAAGAV